MNAVLAEVDSRGTWLEPLFDDAFAATGGMTRLRKLILTLALQGKLVPQDPKEAPASVLVKQIAAEKAALVRAGKIRAPKESNPIADSEKPYTVPRSWEWVRLGELTTFTFGKTPASKNPAYWSNTKGQYWAAISDLPARGYISETKKRVTEAAVVDTFTLPPVPSGTLLMSFKLSIGKTAIATTPMYHNEAIIAFWNLVPALKMYLYWTLSDLANGGDMKSAIKGNTLNSDSLNSLLVPLPPLEEQKRIVARIEELMSRCDELESERSAQESKRREARAAAVRRWLAGDDVAAALLGEHFATLVSTREDVAELRKAILQLAVMGKLVPQDPAEDPASELLKQIEVEKASLVKNGKIRSSAALPSVVGSEKPYPIPDSWRWVRLGGIAQQITSGSRDWAKYYTESGALFVTMGNLSRGSYKLRMETKRYVTPPLGGEGSRTRLEESDLLISITGDVGNLGLIPPDFGEAYINQHTCLLRLMPAFRTRYVPEFLLSPFAKSQFDGPQRGIKNSFRLDDVGEMLIPIPPLEEQRRMVARIDDLMRLCDALEQRIDAAQAKQAELLDAVMARV